jgi:cobaltochelatase CobN
MSVTYLPLPCRASPPRGGRTASINAVVTDRRSRTTPPAIANAISPLVGEMSGRTEVGEGLIRAIIGAA